MEEGSEEFEPSGNFYKPPLYSGKNWLILLGIEHMYLQKNTFFGIIAEK